MKKFIPARRAIIVITMLLSNLGLVNSVFSQSLSCATAPNIPVVSAASCTPSTAFNINGVGTGATYTSCGTGIGSPANNWGKFVAIGTTATISYDPTSQDAMIFAYSGTCGGTLTQLGCVDQGGTGTQENLSLTGLTTGATYFVRIVRWSSTGTMAGNICISSPPPSITATTLAAFGNLCTNTTSGANSFTINGSNLTTANVTVGALAGYTYSTTSGGIYTSSLSLTHSAGTYSQQVFVKFTPTSVQSYNGNIVVAGGGDPTPTNVAASGSGVNSPPTVTVGAATGITINSATVPGTITANGCSGVSAYGIEYSTTNNFATGSGIQVAGGTLSGQNFTASLTGLNGSTVYYYRSYATNTGGTSYSAQSNFTTATPTYKSQFISMTFGSTSWCPGETRTVTVTVKNIGTGTWTSAGSGMNIGLKWDEDPDYGFPPNNIPRQPVQGGVPSGPVAPGATVTYTFPNVAGSQTAGTNHLTFDVVREGICWFADPTGPCDASNTRFISAPITISKPANKTVAAVASAVCTGSGTSITVSTSASGTTYQLRNDANDANIGVAVSGNGGTINLPTGGLTTNTTFNVLATTTATGCTAQMTVTPTVTVSAQPTASAGGSQTICQNGTATVSGATSSNGTIAWTDNGAGSITSGANTLTPTYTAAAGDAGNTVTLTMTVSNNPCTAATATYAVIVKGTPTATAGGSQTICQNGSATVSGATASNGTILWTDNGAGSITSGANTLTPTYTAAAGDGGHTVTLTMAVSNSPCASAVATYSIIVTASPATTGASICEKGNGSLTSTTNCAGTSGTLVASGSGGTSENTTYGSGNTNISINFPSLPPGAIVTSTSVAITYSENGNIFTSSPRSDLRVRATPPAAVGTVQTNLQPSTLSGSGTVTNAPLGSWGTGNPSGTWLFEFREVTDNDFLGTPNPDGNISNITITVDYTVPGTLQWYTTASGGSPIGTGSPFNPVGAAGSVLTDTNTPGTYTYYAVCSTNPGCRTATNFVINPLPTVSFTGLNGSYCVNNGVVTLTGNQASSGTFSGIGITNNGNGTASFNPATAGVGGPYVITYSFTNGNGCTNTSSQNVTVNAIPAITVQPVAPAATCSGGTQTLSVTATGAGLNYSWRKGGVPVVNGGVISGQGTPVLILTNATTVDAGNYDVVVSGTCSPSLTSVTVPVTVNTPPVIICPPSDIINTDPGFCRARKTYSTTATGFPAPSITYSINGNPVTFPYDFPTGITTVDVKAHNACSPDAICSFTVTVNDNVNPGITCQPDVTINNTNGQCNATVTLQAPSTSDNCGVASVTNDHPSNIYPTGTTNVTWTVRDNSNNVNTCVQKVIVTDTELPTIVCNADVNVNNDLGICGANISLSAPTANDNCGIASIINNHPSSMFPVGVTIVTWTVTDNSGNTASCNQSITVTDNEKPKIDCPSSITIVTDPAVNFATITLTALGQPVVTDNCGVATTANDHPSTMFPIGTTLVKWTVTDIHNNTNTCTQTIVVNDTIQPSISFNAPLNINNTPGFCIGTTDITYPNASDNSGHVRVTSDYAALSTASIDPVAPLLVSSVQFPVGATTIVWTATDPSSNSSMSTQTVTVVDNEKPTITCPADISQSNDPGICSAEITLGTPATNDNCGVLSVKNNYPSTTFNVGTTIVTWTVIDIHGNMNTCDQKVIVTDLELPSITSAANVNVTNDNGQCSAEVTLTPPTTNDNCGVQSVTNDHPLTTYPVGTTTVTWTVTDIHGNINTATQIVTVTDSELPTITAPANVSMNNDAGVCTATVNIGNPVNGDNCGVQSVTNDHPSTSYPVGITTVTWTVTDIHGNTNTAIQTVTITDNEKPSITAAADVAVNNDAGACAATVILIDPTAGDNCGVQNVTNDHPSTSYPVGTTIVTWTVTDIHGNTNTAIQTVTVTDNEKPSITTAANISVNNDVGACAAIIALIDPVTNDNCAIQSVTNDYPSTTYPVGTTTVTWTVTDIHGNTNTAIQTVTVTDTEKPTITVADVSVSNDAGVCLATIILADPTTGDNCGVQTVINDHPSTAYPVGTTIVTWTITDIHGNTNTAIQTVTVTDNEQPKITAPADIAINNDAAVCTATVNLIDPITSDNCGVQNVSNDHPSTVYPVGTTTVTWTVTDIHGNMNTTTQTVTVTDNELPTITTAADVSVNNDGSVCSATVTLIDPTTSDNCGVQSISNDHPSTTYPVGTTTVTWTVTDIHGNMNIATQLVTVTDNERPTITAPANMSVNNGAGFCDAIVNIGNPITGDNCGVESVTNDHTSATYPVGTTTITWTVTDIHGNTNVATQTVTVTDNEKPSIVTAPDISVNNDAGLCSATVNLADPTTHDNCGIQSVTNDHPSSTYPEGTTTVTWTVTDIHGNTNTAIQTVTVTDNELPSITAAADVSVSNDAGLCSATVTLAGPTTSDNCGVQDVTNDHLSSTYPVGTTSVKWTVTDIHGNTNTATQIVTVSDSEIPSITPAADISVNNDVGICSATVTLTDPKTADNCGVQIVTNDHSSTSYPVGTTTVTWTVTDIHGNSNTAIQTVTVSDNELPTITAAVNVSVNNDAGVCAATIVLTTPATGDNCGVQYVTNDHPSTTYPVGTTTVTWTITDIHGNANTAIQTVTVTDNELPTITAAANVSVNNDAGVCAATVVLTAPVTGDNCGVQSVTNNHPSTTYPVGTTTVTWTVTDIHGNSNTAIQTVTVTDNEKPTFTRPADKTIYTTSSCTYDASIAATGDVINEHDNCSTGIQATSTDVVTSGLCQGSKIITRTWHLVDNNGNAATDQVQTITVNDNTAPTFTRPADKTIYTTAACTYDASVGATGDVTNEADNCSTGLQATYSDVVSNGTCAGSKIITRTWSLADYCGNAAANQVQVITVSDNIAPVISTCAPSVTVVPNNANCTSILLDYRSKVTATDNCSSVTLTQSPVAGTPLPLGANTITITAKDACGNTTTCNFIVTVNKTLDVTLSNSNPQLYYGYSLDQSTIIKGTPTGGVGPYKVVITMNRILGCNAVTSTGDEVWTASAGGTSAGSTCPVSGTAASIPVSTITNLAAGGSYSVTATLMSNAVFTVTVTDANGCTVSRTTNVYSEDDRCFAGNSGNAKIKICHQTGSKNNPCVQLCVDESAVAAHLAHGDFIGTCTPNCIAPTFGSRNAIAVTSADQDVLVNKLTVKVLPNPTSYYFTLGLQSPSPEKIKITVVDVTGRIIEKKIEVSPNSNIQLGSAYHPGIYFAEVIQGKEKIVVRLIKEGK